MKKILLLLLLSVPTILFSQERKMHDLNLKPVKISSVIQNEADRKEKELEDIKRKSSYSLTANDLISNNVYEKSFETENTKDVLWNNILNWYSVNKNKYELSIISENKDINRIYFQTKTPISIGNDAERTGYIKLSYLFTLQIDCKDKKFRYIVSSRKSEIKLTRGENPRNLSTSTLTAIKTQLEDITSISDNYFNEQKNWEINNTWNSFIKTSYSYNDFNPNKILNSGVNSEKEILESVYFEMIKKDDW